MWNFEFANPNLLYLLAVLPVMVIIYIFRQHRQDPDLQVSSLSSFEGTNTPVRLILRHALFGCKLIGTGLLIVALARPQSVDSWSETTSEGIDISLCMDISGSMRAMDFEPNRLAPRLAEIGVQTQFGDMRWSSFLGRPASIRLRPLSPAPTTI